MFPKTYSFAFAMFFCCALLANPSNNPSSELVNAIRPNLKFDFENCVAFGGGSSADYSEFIAQSSVNSECTQLSVFGDHLFRLNPNRNPHSCAPGMNGTTAMCISADDRCTFFAGHEKAIRVNVMVTPGPDGVGNLDNISFFSMAPRQFQFIEGESGLNNYPTRFGIRVLTEKGEIFRRDTIPTSADWAFRAFDLSNIAATRVTTPTVFQIEILPYCLVGNGAEVAAWDIEDLVITGGCNNVNGGVISTNSNTNFCSANGQSNVVNAILQQNRGQVFSWLVVDENERIVTVQNSSNIGFNALPNGNLRIFNVAYNGPITGLFAGSFLFNLGGCFDLSNPIPVVNRNVSGGDLTGPSGTRVFTTCLATGETILNTSLVGNSGDATQYVLTNGFGQILNISNSGTIDLGNLPPGNYRLNAVSYSGSISGLTVGNNIVNLSGCFDLSSQIDITQSNQVVGGGMVTSSGQTNFSFCNNLSSIEVTLTGNIGTNSAFIITNPQDRIISIQQTLPIAIGGIAETNFSIWNISFENGLAGLEIDGFVSGLSGCFDLSNPINVQREEVDAGNISVNGFAVTSLCLRNNDNQAVQITATGQVGENIIYVITDTNGNIQETAVLNNQSTIDFDNAAPGVCNLYAIAYNGSINGATVGSNVSNVSGSCFDISNVITVERNEVESGSITGPAMRNICLNDPSTANIEFAVSGAIGNFSTWIVTDNNGNILEMTSDPNISFGSAPPGICRVYHLSHSSDPVLLGAGNTIDDIVLACFELSDPVTVTRKETQGGTLTLDNGTSSIMLLLGAGASANVSTVLSSNVGDEVTYISYDPMGTILTVQDEADFDFSAADEGTCFIVAVSHCGDLGGATPGTRIDMLTGCISQSNFVEVTKVINTTDDTLSAGIILTAAGETMADVCVGNSAPDSVIVVFDQLPIGAESNFIVTDDQGEILEIGTDNTFDFSNVGPGFCNIYHVVFDQAPLTGLAVGMNISDLDGEFDLSAPIGVTRNIVEGGTLALPTGETTIDVFIGDNIIDTLDLVSAGALGDSSVFIITNNQGVISEIPEIPVMAENQFPGTCLVWNLSYSGGLQGLEVGATVPEIMGCFDLSNPVTVNKIEFVGNNPLDGGILVSDNSQTAVDVCLDGRNMILEDLTLEGAEGDNMSFVLTDTEGVVTDLGFDLPYDFSGAQQGACLIWNISWNGTLPDLEIGVDLDDLTGDFELSNSVTFIKTEVDGGILMTTDSLTELSIIVGDGDIDSIDVILEETVGPDLDWIITDDEGLILALPASPPFVLEGAGQGICFIYNVSSITLDGLETGNNIADLAGCFSLSNGIQVTRTEAVPVLDGGMLTTLSGVTDTTLCIGLGNEDLDVAVSGALGDTMTFIIADLSGFIWGIFDNPSFQFNGSNPGTCEIWHISYNGAIMGLAPGQDLDDLAGDFDLSNPVTVFRDEVDGGSIETDNGLTEVTVTLGGAMTDTIDVVLTEAEGDNLAWVLTDEMGDIVSLPSGPPFTFEGLGAGVCQLWNLSFADGLAGAEIGNNTADLDGCFELSNPITVTRTVTMVVANGGDLITTDSLTTAELCLASNETTVDVLLSGATGENMTFAITDSTGTIISLFASGPFDFGGLSTGVCSVTHVSYNGTLMGLEVGEALDTLSGDFSLSNPIVVQRDDAVGGSLMTSGGLTDLTIIVGDGDIDSIDVVLVGNEGDTSVWLITDDIGNILALPDAPPFILEGAGPGVCGIWNLSHSFGLTGVAIGNNVSQLDGCYELSNPINVTRNNPPSTVSGGILSLDNGQDSLDICLNSFDLTGTFVLEEEMGDTTVFVITDAAGIILDTTFMSEISFAAFGTGECNVWNLSYDGALTGFEIGTSVDSIMGDFQFSNSVFVSKLGAEGGLAQFADTTFQTTIAVGDGMPDTLDLLVAGALGDTLQWVVTEDNGVILELLAGPQAIFSDTTATGQCRIYHVAGTDGLTGLEVGNNINIDLEGCFDLSNFLFVQKENNTLVAGNLMTVDSMSTADLCIGDNGAELALLLSGANGTEESFVVTDVEGIILSLQSASPISFPASMTQTCLVSHVVFDSILTGLVVGEDLDTLSGNFLLSNAVTVNKMQLDGSAITLSNGMTSADVTTADGEPDTLIVSSSGILADTSVYILVDNGVISTVQASDTFVFENQPTGVCQIFELSYNAGINGLTGGSALADLEGCFALSNEITVTKTSLAGINGGVITTPIGNNVDVCLINTVSDTIAVSLANVAGDTTAWVVTDTFGLILALPDTSLFTFDTLAAGACQIWHLSYNPPLTGLEIGENIDTLVGLHDFSNAINVDKNEAEAGSLLTSAGMTSDTIFLGSVPPDSLFVDLTGVLSGDNMTWVVSDTFGNILDLNAVPPFTFETTGAGQCDVRHMTYANGISGLQLGSNINTDLSGCFDFSEAIRVIKVTSTSNLVDGGTIQEVGGATIVDVCRGDMVEDSIDVAITGQLGPNFSFVVTNQNGLLLRSIDTTQMIRDIVRVPVDGFAADTLFLYHMAYQNGVNTNLGANLFNNPLLDLSNPITIATGSVGAGALNIQMDTISIIVGDGIIDSIDVSPFGNVVGDVSNWVVHDDAGVIVSIDAGPPFTFENAGDGIFNIRRYVSLTGLTGLAVGNNVADLDGCFDFTNPQVVVTEQASLSGGMLTSIDSTTIVDYCFSSTVVEETLEVILTDTLGESFAWVITDPAGVILDLPSDSLFVFDANSAPTSLVWNLSFEGSLVGLEIGENVDTLMGEFLFSNPVTVSSEVVNGGVLSTPGGQSEFTFCVGDGDPNIVNFTLADTVGGNYQYVVTDTLNSILLVPNPGNDFQDFEGFGDGVCRVYNLSSTQEILGLVPGMQLDSLEGCIELSNFLTINKNGVDGSNISSVPIALDNVIAFCTTDGMQDELVLSTQSTMGLYQYVVTDTNNEIDSVLAGNVIDFEGSDFGTCRIWGISYTGDFIGMPGDTVGVQAMSTDCEDIATLPIDVIKEDCSNLIMTEVIGTTQVELLNNGTAPTNAAPFFMCGANGDYSIIAELPIVCGDTILEPGDYLILDLANVITIDPADGELAIYNSPQFGSFAAMEHYVEWGSSPHNRTSIAIGADLWFTGQFAVPFTTTTALKYDGSGILNTDWSEGSSTSCAPNLGGGGGVSSRLVYETYPNPTTGNFKLFIPTLPDEKGTLEIYDNFGRIVDRREVKAGIEYEIDLNNYGSGLFYTKVLSGRQGVVKKMMILK